jgi:hypothetical protein
MINKPLVLFPSGVSVFHRLRRVLFASYKMSADKENDQLNPNKVILKGHANYQDWSSRIRAKLEADETDSAIWDSDSTPSSSNSDDDDGKKGSKSKQKKPDEAERLKSEAKKKRKERRIKKKAYNTILASIDPAVQRVYKHCPHGDPIILWNTLEKEFARKDASIALHTKQKIPDQDAQ